MNIRAGLNWVPNLFTLGNLTLGFFAILFSAREGDSAGSLALSCGLILLACLCDGLDGYAARLLKAQSDLGAQLDSLADLTAFGIAPAVVMYSFALRGINPVVEGITLPIGMALSAVYPACAAYRLARFNVAHDPTSFQGLPSPVAGVIVALMPLGLQGSFQIPVALMVVIFVGVAFLMVSTIKYSKPQATVFKRFNPVRLGILIAFIVIALIAVGILRSFAISAALLFMIVLVYGISGVIALILHAVLGQRQNS
ncbi:MAG TPA: CDP-diacylglycerol--serine O-phosphatidyltransferase, partial [Leptospiraceae bacterium]|nr:CDP-diacylglycerol--serine O-phosphatidyltransferase [Leptospiraceae bacterium]